MLFAIFYKPSSWREPWLRDFVGVTRSFLGSPRSVGPNLKLHYQTGNSGFSSHNYFHFHSSSVNNIRQKWEYRRWEFPQGGPASDIASPGHTHHPSSVSTSQKCQSQNFHFLSWLLFAIPFVINKLEQDSPFSEMVCVCALENWLIIMIGTTMNCDERHGDNYCICLMLWIISGNI